MRKFGRGYDLKLLKEAQVLVLVNDPSMTKTEVIQMLGRSCRAMGPVSGAIYLQESMVECDAWELLESRTTINFHEGSQVLREIILVSDQINSGSRIEEFRRLYEAGDWKENLRRLKSMNHSMLKFLTKLQQPNLPIVGIKKYLGNNRN